VLFAIAYLRPIGESPLRPIAFGIVVSALGGWACGFMAKVVERAAGD
jgi:hypothetical protein